jgi:hypothetical protein
MVYRNISLSDVIACDGYDGSIESRNRILWSLGVDTTQDIEILQCTHRNLRNQVVSCEYYMGFERTDKAWVNSPYSSLEVVIASSDDPTKRRMLREMSVQGYQGAINEGGEQ